jgi:predicted permease
VFWNYLVSALYVWGFIAIGIVIRHTKILELFMKSAFRFLNVVILWVILPTIVFVSIARYSVSEILGFSNAAVFAFVGLGISFVLAVGLSILMHHDRETTVAVTLNSAFMNVAYLGLPLVYVLTAHEPPRPGLGPTWGLGPASLYAVAIGIPHLILGIALATSVGEKQATLGFVLRSVLAFPTTTALIASLLFVGFDAYLWDTVRNIFDTYLVKLFSVLMLLFVGYQMPLVNPKRYLSKLITVGTIRFLVCPLLTFAMVSAVGLNINGDLSPKPSLILSMMPPAVFNIVLAYNFKLNSELYSTMVFYPTLIFLFVVLPVMIYLVF